MDTTIELSTPTKEAENLLDNYFVFNKFVLRTCGMWIPSKNEAYKCLKWLYTIFIIIYCVFIYYPAEAWVLFDKLSLSIIVRSFRDMLNHICCHYKLFNWFVRRKRIIKCMKVLQTKQYLYEEHGEFSPREILKQNKKEADVWAKVFLLGVNGICINMVLTVLYVALFQSDEQYIEEDGKMIYAQQLPVRIRIPFERTTKTSVLLSFVFEIIPLDIYAWIIVGLDTMFTSIMSCIGAHLMILQGGFKTIRGRCIKKLNMPETDILHDSEELSQEMYKEMHKCVKHLQCLIEVSKEVEEIYNFQTCVQVMISLFEMCFCLFLLSTAFDENFGPEGMYLFSTAFELLLYCWFGNVVIESSQGIPNALYESDWLSSTETFKKDMLITMIRMRRNIHMTIGKFTPLAFTTFLTMARVAYSFFTVLKSNAFGK